MKRKIFIALLVVVIGIQAIRPSKNEGQASGPHDITHYAEVPENVMSILKMSCYDCHSNHTSYRWYHEIMPVGWWMSNHVEEGKEHLNFSDLSSYNKKKLEHKLEETAEEVEEHEMPLSSYTLLHSEARLSEEQIRVIHEWVQKERAKLNADLK